MRAVLCALPLALVVAVASAQELVDRVMARVNGETILLSDVRAASGLGLVDPSPSRAVEQLAERRLVLAEVARFPPPEPRPEQVEAEMVRLMAAAGAGLETLMDTAGLTDAQVRDMARDSLRIRAYLDQRFGLGAPVSEEQARQYYDEHPGQFIRDGVRRPYEEVAADVRREAAEARREAAVQQWLRDVRARAEVVIVAVREPPPSAAPGGGR